MMTHIRSALPGVASGRSFPGHRNGLDTNCGSGYTGPN